MAIISTFPLSSSAKQVVSTHKISSLVVPFLSRDPTNCANSNLGFRVGIVAGVVVIALTQAGFLGGCGDPWLWGWSWGWFLMWHPTLWQMKHLLSFICSAFFTGERWMASMSMAVGSLVVLGRKDLMLPPPWRAAIHFCWAWNLLACLIHSFSMVGMSLTDRTICPRLGSSPVAKALMRVFCPWFLSMLWPIESPQCISGILSYDPLGFEQGNSWFSLSCFGCQRGKRSFWNWLPFCPRFSHCLGWWHH